MEVSSELYKGTITGALKKEGETLIVKPWINVTTKMVPKEIKCIQGIIKTPDGKKELFRCCFSLTVFNTGIVSFFDLNKYGNNFLLCIEACDMKHGKNDSVYRKQLYSVPVCVKWK